MSGQLTPASVVIIGSALCAIGAALLVVATRHQKQVERVSTWATTEGVVTRSEVEFIREHGYFPLVEYRYEVHDERFTSRRVSFGVRWGATFTKRIAGTVLARYPLGARVRVYFDGSQPGEACLEPGPGRGAAAIVQVVGGALLAGGIGCLQFAI